MLDLKGEHTSQLAVQSGADLVIQTLDIPAGCELRSINTRVHVIGAAVANEREQAAGYAAKAMMIEVEDPDTRVAADVMLDRFLPKYTDVETIDLDTTTADTTPFWEPGEGVFEEIFEMGNTPLITFSRKKLMSFADPGSAGLRFQPAETPFEPQWFGADMFHVKLNRPIRTKRPTTYLLAMAAPSFDDTTTTRSQLGENEWGLIQYAEATLERALMHQLGLFEVGAETPWIEASGLLREYLAPQTLEITAGAFLSETWTVFVQSSYTVRVPGRLAFKAIDLTP